MKLAVQFKSLAAPLAYLICLILNQPLAASPVSTEVNEATDDLSAIIRFNQNRYEGFPSVVIAHGKKPVMYRTYLTYWLNTYTCHGKEREPLERYSLILRDADLNSFYLPGGVAGLPIKVMLNGQPTVVNDTLIERKHVGSNFFLPDSKGVDLHLLARARFDTNYENIRIRFTAYRTHIEKHAAIHPTPYKITRIEATELPEGIESEIICAPDYKDEKVFHAQLNCEELGPHSFWDNSPIWSKEFCEPAPH